MNPKIDVMAHGYNIWLVAILRPDFILRDQERKWEIHHCSLKVTFKSRSGQGQVKSGQILKLVVWTKIGVYSIQLSSASSTIPVSALSVV